MKERRQDGTLHATRAYLAPIALLISALG